MSLKIAINGFGRIGRLLFRSLWNVPGIEVVQINDPVADLACSAHLLEFDSVHGRFMADQVSFQDDYLCVGNQKFLFTRGDKLATTDWQSIDLLAECSGRYKTNDCFDPVFAKGVKKVLVSCPVKDGDTLNIVYGVNHQLYDPAKNHLITAASCTTNCLAPVVKVLLENFGIEQGAMTTIHDITNTQAIIDTAHKDFRRARACGESLIPTSSGATSAIMKIFPELEGKLDGLAVRVPLLNASLVDLVVKTSKKTSVEEVNRAMQQASQLELKDILGFDMRPLVSVDYKDDTRSAIVDGLSTQVINGDLVKIIAWYDNEINYVSRMKDIMLMVAGLK